MRKLAVVIAILVLIGGGYAAYWYKQADNLKRGFVQATDSVNASVRAANKGAGADFFHYDGIAVSGFPFDMVIDVQKPVISVNISSFIGNMQEAKGNAKPLPYEWVEEITYGDKMRLTANMAGTNFTSTIYGDAVQKSYINKQVRHTLNIHMGSPIACKFSMYHPKSGGPASVQAMIANADTFFSVFHSFSCNVDGYALKDTSGNAILTSDGYSFSADNEQSSGPNHKIGLMVAFEKLKATPGFDAIMNDYMLMIYTLIGQPEQANAMVPPSVYGEQTFKIDAQYDGPINQGALADNNLNLHLDVNHFDIQTALSSVVFSAHVAMVPQGNDHSLSVSMHADSQVNDRYDQIMQKHFADLLRTLSKPQDAATAAHDPDPKATEFFRKMATLGTPEQTVAQVYPQFHTFGKTAFDFDLNIKGPSDSVQFMQHGAAALDKFDWVATPYGVRMKGAANSSGPGKPPVGDLSITCISCDALITDLGGYAMRVEALVDQLSKEPKLAYVNKDLIEGVRAFVHGISENASASDLIIHFVSRGAGNFTVSNKQLPEVMALYMTTIAPRMAQPSPSAGGGQPELSAPPTPQGQ